MAGRVKKSLITTSGRTPRRIDANDRTQSGRVGVAGIPGNGLGKAMYSGAGTNSKPRFSIVSRQRSLVSNQTW